MVLGKLFYTSELYSTFIFSNFPWAKSPQRILILFTWLWRVHGRRWYSHSREMQNFLFIVNTHVMSREISPLVAKSCNTFVISSILESLLYKKTKQKCCLELSAYKEEFHLMGLRELLVLPTSQIL
jgi:hypothetical protein